MHFFIDNPTSSASFDDLGMYMFTKTQLKELKDAYEHCRFENLFSFSALKGFKLVLGPEVRRVVKHFFQRHAFVRLEPDNKKKWM